MQISTNMLSKTNLLSGHTTKVQAIAERLRSVILDAAPDMLEKVYPGWRALGYTHPQAGYVCAIFPHSETVKLGFEHGASLYDPEGLLQSGPSKGKQVRYLEFHHVEEIEPEVILGFLFEAIRFRAG